MNGKVLTKLLRQIIVDSQMTVTDEGYRLAVVCVTSFEADLLADCLIILRNVAAEVLANRVYIPIDEAGYTIRANEHDPEPRP